jgi:hypothetical protein
VKQPDTEVATVCDVYEPNLAKGLAVAPGAKPEHDFRRVLEKRDIDAVIIATPDHWHPIQTILACEAGKDVYVEKPIGVTVTEGRAMVRAARRYERIVQAGTQQRSGKHFQQAAELVKSGRIGKVTQVRTWNFGNESPAGIGNPPDGAPPKVRARGQPRDARHHPRDLPVSRLHLHVREPRDECRTDQRQDERDAVPRHGGHAVRRPAGAGDRSRDAQVRRRDGRAHEGLEVENSNQHHLDHMKNFLECVRSRNKPIADIEMGHRSTTTALLGNIAYRTGHRIEWDGARERIVGDAKASAHLARDYRRPWKL